MPRPIFLTGMMGSGKTTIGRLLASHLAAAFIDLDARIERVYGRSIGELFAEGEPHFRRCERRALESLVAEPGFGARVVVVATGGGIILDPCNRQTMAAVGTVVHLEVPLDDLVVRLQSSQARAARPLVAAEGSALRERLGTLLSDRKAAYRTAECCIDGRGTPSEVVARLQSELSCHEPDSRAV